MGTNTSSESAPAASSPSPMETPKKRAINKTTIKPKPIRFTKFIMDAVFTNFPEEGTWFLNSLTEYVYKHGQNLDTVSTTDSNFQGVFKNLESLGLALEFIMTNRPIHVEIKIFMQLDETEGNYAKSIIQFNSDCSKNLEPVQGGPSIPEVDSKKNIEVFHVHGHFDENTEGICIGLHEATIKYLRNLKYDIHHYVCFVGDTANVSRKCIGRRMGHMTNGAGNYKSKVTWRWFMQWFL